MKKVISGAVAAVAIFAAVSSSATAKSTVTYTVNGTASTAALYQSQCPNNGSIVCGHKFQDGTIVETRFKVN